MRRLIAGVALLALLAGCGIPEANGPAAPTAVVQGVSGGVLSVGITTPQGIEPASAYEPSGQEVVSAMCDTLMTIDPKTGALRPGLVKSWQVSGTTITLRLRSGLVFNDGSRLKAKDVAFSLSRLASEVEAPYTYPLVNGIIGAAAANEDLTSGFDTGTLLHGLTAPNATTIQISSAAPELLRALAEPATAPISEKAYLANPKAFVDDPVCVGPYKLQRPYTPGDPEITLVRGAYDGKSHAYTDGGKGYPDEIDFHVYPTDLAAYAAYRLGTVDIAPLPYPKVDEARRLLGSSIASGRSSYMEYIGLPQDVPALTSPLIRKALSLALDRSAITTTVWDGTRDPALSILPSQLAGSSSCQGISASGDVSAAQALVAKAQADATTSGSDLTSADLDLAKQTWTLTTDSSGEGRAETAAIAQAWHAAFGVTVKVAVLTPGDYLTGAAAGFAGPFRMSWQGDYLSDQEYLQPLFTTGAHANVSRFSDRLYDVNLPTAEQEPEDVVRARDFQGLVRQLCAELPIIPLAQARTEMLIRPTLSSARGTFFTADGSLLLREVFRK